MLTKLNVLTNVLTIESNKSDSVPPLSGALSFKTARFEAVSETVTCPGLFCPTIAVDGVLTRIRVTGGQLSIEQLSVLAAVMERSHCAEVLVTNRANVQLRSTQKLTEFDLSELQSVKLAAKNPAIDHLRNVMVSPMAGLEPGIFDVIPAIWELENYICHEIEQTPNIEALSAKFSIGLDGCEVLSVRDRSNDVWLVAEPKGYRLVLNLGDGEEWSTDWVSGNAVSLVRGVVDRYLQFVDQVGERSVKHRRSRKPRLREVIRSVGKERFLGSQASATLSLRPLITPTEQMITRAEQMITRAEQMITRAERSRSLNSTDDLIHNQFDREFVTLEMVCPLGKVSIEQIKGLITVLQKFALDQIRLTPWQTLMIPNVRRSGLPSLKTALTQISFNPNPNHPARSIVACSGKSGCQSAATHAQEHAAQLIERFTELQMGYYDRPFSSLQISGCEKCCAQPKGCDINLIGFEINNQEYYQLQDHLISIEQAIDRLTHPIPQN